MPTLSLKKNIKITIKPIIILPLNLILKLNKEYRQIYNLFFLLAFLVNNIILKEYKTLIYTTVTTI